MISESIQIQTLRRELPADLETPVSLYLKLRGAGPSFLLESVEGGEHIARYSFIGVRPRAEYIIRGSQVEIRTAQAAEFAELEPGQDPTVFLQEQLAPYAVQPLPQAPRFNGGLAGYLSFEAVRYFEPTLQAGMAAPALPDGIFLLADVVVAFVNARRTLSLLATVLDGDAAAAERRLDEIQAAIAAPLPAAGSPARRTGEMYSNLTRTQFEEMVRTAKEHIAAGDIFQVVLSQRFSRQTDADPFEVYRAVRRVNPSPYMFFFDFGAVDGEPLALVGASPEMFVRLEGRTAALRPIAGTRPRGATPAGDAALAEELLADPKERAEHVMLVDLGRNDLGRVCEYGSLHLTDFFAVERYSHVMHLVSHVEGRLCAGLNAFDLLRAAFPAGTVSGAPKVRALELIAELEPDTRGAYAGLVGYVGFDGAMDTCLALRTMIAQGGTLSVQAGAGIVADSDPAAEYQETVNKARAMLTAIDQIVAAN
jgi:anthranilate synthase component 1